MGDEGDYWRDVNAHFKKKKQERDSRIRPIIENKLEKLSKKYSVEKKTEYQYRINEVLDIYPQNQRYHDIKKNKRGDYQNMIKFVNNFFRKEE